MRKTENMGQQTEAAQNSTASPSEVINETRFPVSQSTACFSLALIASCSTRVLENPKGQKVQHIRARVGSLHSWAKDIWFRAKHACSHARTHTRASFAALACFYHHFSSLYLSCQWFIAISAPHSFPRTKEWESWKPLWSIPPLTLSPAGLHLEKVAIFLSSKWSQRH